MMLLLVRMWELVVKEWCCEADIGKLGCPGFGSLLVDFGMASTVTLEVTGRRGRRVAAPPRGVSS